MALEVTISKLKRYAKEQGGYEIVELDGDFELSFVPSFPEALEKSYSDVQPRVVMRGKSRGDKVTFLEVEIEDERGRRFKDLPEAELTYRSWLEFIEHNY